MRRLVRHCGKMPQRFENSSALKQNTTTRRSSNSLLLLVLMAKVTTARAGMAKVLLLLLPGRHLHRFKSKGKHDGERINQSQTIDSSNTLTSDSYEQHSQVRKRFNRQHSSYCHCISFCAMCSTRIAIQALLDANKRTWAGCRFELCLFANTPANEQPKYPARKVPCLTTCLTLGETLDTCRKGHCSIGGTSDVLPSMKSQPRSQILREMSCSLNIFFIYLKRLTAGSRTITIAGHLYWSRAFIFYASPGLSVSSLSTVVPVASSFGFSSGCKIFFFRWINSR
jgi:hypothetical protein